MDTTALSQQIGDLTSALGDPTRRGIYIAVRQSSEGHDAAHIATVFDIHANVARHHLDRLVDEGYLVVEHRRKAGKAGPGAGRPSKWYSVSEKQINVHFPSQTPDLLTELLMRLLAEVAPSDIGAIARRVGQEYGTELAAQIGVPSETGFEEAVKAVVAAMTGVGFGMSADMDASRLLTNHCPFGETAINHPDVVCALDQGLVAGLMASVDDCNPVVQPHAAQNDDCITEVAITLS